MDDHRLPTRSLSNEFIRLDFLATAGPRVVGLCLHNTTENLLAETPDIHWPTPHGEYHLRGGHRLWHAPEAKGRTSIPDNNGLIIEEMSPGVRLQGKVEPGTGISKSIEICLASDRPALTLVHRLTNLGLWPVELAPWAITQLPLGGVAILPQKVSSAGLQPDRQLVLWPYTRWTDARLRLGDEYLLLHGRAQLPPIKIGYFNDLGWAGYLMNATFFVKRFPVLPNTRHADRGCNLEAYCNDLYFELETLGPLAHLDPGATVTHLEVWDIISIPNQMHDYLDLFDLVQSLAPI